MTFRGAPPDDLVAPMNRAGIQLLGVRELDQAIPAVREVERQLAVQGPSERVALYARLQTVVSGAPVLRARWQVLAAITELRAWAGPGGLNLWDPRLEEISAAAEALTAAAGGLDLEIPRLPRDVAPDPTTSLAKQAWTASATAARQGDALQQELEWAQGLVLWRARATLLEVAAHFETGAARTGLPGMAARQRSLAQRLRQLASAVTVALPTAGS